MTSMRDESKKNFTGHNTIESINCGSLQRIADATEKMAASYDRVREDRDYYQRRYSETCAMLNTANRRINALRGVITKIKRK